MSNISIEELLAKAENKVRSSKRSENNVNVTKYIDNVGWQAGTLAVPTYVIYWHYRSIYDMTHDKSKANRVVFFRTFNKRFPTYRKNTQRYYLLSEGVVELTDEVLKKARIYDKNHGQRKKRVRLPGQEGNNEN